MLRQRYDRLILQPPPRALSRLRCRVPGLRSLAFFMEGKMSRDFHVDKILVPSLHLGNDPFTKKVGFS
jgi:hypothetical protein